jgi:type IV secretion system protein TrbL
MKAISSPTQWGRVGLCLVVLAMLLVSHPAHADTRIFDDIAQQYKSASGGWMAVMLGYANRLFMLLATIELAWSFAVWALEKKEFDSFTATLVKKIMWIGTFYALLLNGPVWIPAIIDSFVDAGSAAGGSAGLSPTEVFNTGMANAATMVGGMSALDILKDPMMMIFGGLSAIVMVLAFSVLAGQLLIALVEGYIAVSAGMLFLGFGGSRWTTDFVQKFIGYAVATGVKLFILYLIVGIGNTQAATWAAQLTAALGGPGGEKFNVIMTVMGGSVLLMYMAMQTPAFAASMLSGSPALTAGGAAATGGALAAGIIGAGAGAAAATVGAAKATGGIASAAKAAWGEAGAQGASGLGRAVATLGNMGSAAGAVMKSSAASSLAPSFGGRMADVSSARSAEKAASASAPPASPQASTPPAPAAPPSSGSDSASPTNGESTPAPASPGGSGAATEVAPAGVGATEAAPATPTPTIGTNAAPAAPSGGTVTPPAPAIPSMGTPAGGDFASMLDPKGVSPGSTEAAPASAAPAAPAAPSGGSVSSAAPASSANSIGSTAPTSASPQAAVPQGPGLQDRLNEMRRVQPPQIPSDGAPPATVSIRFDAPQD